MAEPSAIEIALIVTDVLEKADVPYLIGGSLASIVYGTVRATLDADLVADLQSGNINLFVEELGKTFFLDPASAREAVAKRTSFNLLHRETFFKVDIFVAKPRAFERMQLERRQKRTVVAEPVREAWVASAEDTILAKLEWYRLGDEVSERQWRDVLGVIKSQGERLDTVYLRHWAEELGVADLLDNALTAGLE